MSLSSTAFNLRLYPYGTRARVTTESQQPIGKLSINSQGVLVFMTPRIMFVDIDKLDEGVLERADEQAQHLGLSFRAYRTFAGYRLLESSRVFQFHEALSLLAKFETDHRYLACCERSKCFRARLTAKSKRLEIGTLPYRLPSTEKYGQIYHAEWSKDYQVECKQYAVCHYVASIGLCQESTDEVLTTAIRVHDEWTQAHDFDRELK